MAVMKGAQRDKGQFNIRQALAPLVDLIYPPRCPSCGEGLAAQEGLCADCWGQLEFPADPACALCQRAVTALDSLHDDRLAAQPLDPHDRHAVHHGAPICADCRADPPPHDGVAAGTLYNDASRKLVLAFKHGGRIALAPMLARMIAARLPELPGEWLIVPVPLHRLRLWKRGFNQSGLLARELARLRSQRLLVDGLVRPRATDPLGSLGKAERARMLEGAVAVNSRRARAIDGAQVLLVDDVLTSGATTNACVAVLRQAGARRVQVACFARVLE